MVVNDHFLLSTTTGLALSSANLAAANGFKCAVCRVTSVDQFGLRCTRLTVLQDQASTPTAEPECTTTYGAANGVTFHLSFAALPAARLLKTISVFTDRLVLTYPLPPIPVVAPPIAPQAAPAAAAPVADPQLLHQLIAAHHDVAAAGKITVAGQAMYSRFTRLQHTMPPGTYTASLENFMFAKPAGQAPSASYFKTHPLVDRAKEAFYRFSDGNSDRSPTISDACLSDFFLLLTTTRSA